MAYEVLEKTVSVDGKPDKDYILRSSAGDQVVIASSTAAAIEDLNLQNATGTRGRLVFGHYDLFDALEGLSLRREDLEYTQRQHELVTQLRRENLMFAGVALTHWPGRVFGGQYLSINPNDRGYTGFSLRNSHTGFGSVLHLGDGRYVDYSLTGLEEKSDFAEITLTGNVGENLKEQGFPQGIVSEAKYKLKNGVLRRERTTVNNTDRHLFVPGADHGSYSPRSRSLTSQILTNALNLMLKLHSNGEFELDGLKVETGRKLNGPAIYDDCEAQRLPPSDFEHLYGLLAPQIDIFNFREGIGLRIIADPQSKLVYTWKPTMPPILNAFVSVQPRCFPTGAAFLPSFNSPNTPAELLKKFHEFYVQTRDFLIAPGESRTEVQTFEAI